MIGCIAISIAVILLLLVAFAISPILAMFIIILFLVIGFMSITSEGLWDSISKAISKTRSERPETKECLYCKETIKRVAIVCPHCQQKLP